VRIKKAGHFFILFYLCGWNYSTVLFVLLSTLLSINIQLIMQIAPGLYKEVLKIVTSEGASDSERVLALLVMMERLLIDSTKQEQLVFSTLFARLSYVGHKHRFDKGSVELLHLFRRAATSVRQGRPVREGVVHLGVKAVSSLIQLLYDEPISEALHSYFSEDLAFNFVVDSAIASKSVARVVALRDESEHKRLIVIDEDSPAEERRVLYDLPSRNENFRPTIEALRRVFGFPVMLHLIEVEIDNDGNYLPRAFVVEPDYLVDVSAIADCFKDTGTDPLSYLLKKFLPTEISPAIHIGNVANYFLDRLLNEPQARFLDLFKETFVMSPLVYAPMSDSEVREVGQKAQLHYVTLQRMANGGFIQEGIDPSNCVLEPSFYSPTYGIQGRLDLFYHTKERSVIVELKSGKVWKPNTYGISRPHFTQTLLYDLLVRSVFGKEIDPAKYILYSGNPEKPLCFAPTVVEEQLEALQVRNQLVAIERLLCRVVPGQEEVPLLAQIRGDRYRGQGFMERDVRLFEDRYTKLNQVQKKYFHSFIGFIAREQWLAKVGEHSEDQSGGHASLWRSAYAEKQACFSILSHLRIVENCADRSDPYLLFERTGRTESLSNFRVGDIAILHPSEVESAGLTHHQVIKCTITQLTTTHVRVQLRYRQFNLEPFARESLWMLEPDLMEVGFAAMYRSLFEHPDVVPVCKQALSEIEVDPRPGLTEEQQRLLAKMLNAPGYFLLWGPPGTGKTSVMIREFARGVLTHTEDNLLLLAFTNRAVDEICEALDAIGDGIREQYIRIGSKHATSIHFSEQLLQHKISQAANRSELVSVLSRHRIFVSTVASFSQNVDMLKVKRFQRLLVDEASQILEPQLIGLLNKFDQYILVGDHRQLPAVTSQGADLGRVVDLELNSFGLFDLRASYFERVYRLCEERKLDQHFGRLSVQGRMNEEIMAFPNEYFYNGFLRAMYPTPLSEGVPSVRFVATNSGPSIQPNQKTDRAEAEKAVQLVKEFKALWEAAGRAWYPQRTLGIITPWRAQIAQLRECLVEEGIAPEEVTIDTVERYQGGARDIIIVSCCVNSRFQLSSLVNLSEEGVDRKLNVALTRARQYLVVLGREDILKEDDRYRFFIERYKVPE